MVKKIIVLSIGGLALGLIGCLALWWLFIPKSFEEALYSSIQSKCKNQARCIVSLHELTPFKWDKAYFFESKSSYNININKVIGDKTKIQQDVLTTLVVFTKGSKIVEEQIFELIYSDYYDIGFPPLFQLFPRESVDILFDFNKRQLQAMNYSRDINDFEGLVGILYYELTPKNDQLHASCRTFYLKAGGGKVAESQCELSFVNLNQIVLFNPKTHKQ